jgi:hypothetical protein
MKLDYDAYSAMRYPELFRVSYCETKGEHYSADSNHLISTVVPSSSVVGFFFGTSICSIPLVILALTLEDNISSGNGILR